MIDAQQLRDTNALVRVKESCYSGAYSRYAQQVEPELSRYNDEFVKLSRDGWFSLDEIEVLQGVWGTEHPNGIFCNECTQKQVSKSLCGDCQHDFDFVHRE